MAYIRNLINREPAMMLATIIGVGALGLPLVIVPLRRKLGLPTYQWDADTDVDAHPFLHKFGDNYKRFSFDNAHLLAEWAQHDEYAYLKPLTPRAAADASRDFPEARERLKGRSW